MSERKERLECWPATARTLYSLRSVGPILVVFIQVGVDRKHRKQARRTEETKSRVTARLGRRSFARKSGWTRLKKSKFLEARLVRYRHET